jgi:hypothetical protein
MRMKILMLSGLAVLAGCGGSDGTAPITQGAKLAHSQACINCHATETSSGTGNLIVQEWKASAHNTRDGAGCADCHEPINHPSNSCAVCHNGNQLVGVDEIQRNPDRAGKCQKCHDNPLHKGLAANSTFGYSEKTARNQMTVWVQKAHFNNITGAGYTDGTYAGSYVTYSYTTGTPEGKSNACNKCHNPHDTTTAMAYNRDWSRNAHGSTAALEDVNEIRKDARGMDRDFKTAGTYLDASQVVSDHNFAKNYSSCVRCHTTTGFITYLESGYKKLPPFGPIDPATGKTYEMNQVYRANPSAKMGKIAPAWTGKETIACNACHNGYNWKNLRPAGQLTTYFNLSGASGKLVNFSKTFPNANSSNLCVACHTGRLIGDNIKIIDIRGQDWSNAERIQNHERAAAQTLYGIGGFEFYSSNSAKSLDYTTPKLSHQSIGMNQVAWNGKGPYAGDPRGYGPCIGCHMNSNGSDGSTSHTSLPVNASASATGMPGGNSNMFNADSLPKPIDTIVSKACPACHTQTYALTPAQLQAKKELYWAAVVALRELTTFCLHSKPALRTFDSNRPTKQKNWYQGSSSDPIQSWLCSTPSDYLAATFTDPGKGVTKQLHKAIYNMGSYYNALFVIYDPGAFAHNSLYTKRLIYDSMDYLDDGIINQSVAAKVFNTPIVGGNDSFDMRARLQSLGFDAQKAYDFLMAQSQGKRP